MFKPKKFSNNSAVLYCATCIKMQTAKPLQAVTIFSGTALCPEHLQNYTQFQFLEKERGDYRHLEVDN